MVGSRDLGLGMLPGNDLLDTIRGGCSGLGAAAGVLFIVENVFTVTTSGDAGVLGIVENVFTVMTSGDEFGARVTVLFVLTSLMEKSRSQEMVSRSSGE